MAWEMAVYLFDSMAIQCACASGKRTLDTVWVVVAVIDSQIGQIMKAKFFFVVMLLLIGCQPIASSSGISVSEVEVGTGTALTTQATTVVLPTPRAQPVETVTSAPTQTLSPMPDVSPTTALSVTAGITEFLTCDERVSISNMYQKDGLPPSGFVQGRFIDEETVELTLWDDTSQNPYLTDIWRVQIDGSKAQQVASSRIAPLADPCKAKCEIYVFSQSRDRKWQLAHIVSADSQQDGIWLIGVQAQVKLLDRLDVMYVEWQWSDDNSLLWLAHPYPYGNTTDTILVWLQEPLHVVLNPVAHEPLSTANTISQTVLLPSGNLLLSRYQTSLWPWENHGDGSWLLESYTLQNRQVVLTRTDVVTGMALMAWDVSNQQVLMGVEYDRNECFVVSGNRSVVAKLASENCYNDLASSVLAHALTFSPAKRHLLVVDVGDVRMYTCHRPD